MSGQKQSLKRYLIVTLYFYATVFFDGETPCFYRKQQVLTTEPEKRERKKEKKKEKLGIPLKQGSSTTKVTKRCTATITQSTELQTLLKQKDETMTTTTDQRIPSISVVAVCFQNSTGQAFVFLILSSKNLVSPSFKRMRHFCNMENLIRRS